MALRNLEKEIDLVLRHVRILGVLKEKGPLGIRRISDETGIPNHQVRYSLRVLEKAGVLNPTSKGAKLNDGVGSYLQELAKKMEDLEKQMSDVSRLTRRMADSA